MALRVQSAGIRNEVTSPCHAMRDMPALVQPVDPDPLWYLPSALCPLPQSPVLLSRDRSAQGQREKG